MEVHVTNSIQLIQQAHYRNALEGSEDFRIGERVIGTVTYTDDLVLWLWKKQYYRA
jgi:hypothetical protein